jgi:hypothetical protein
VVKVRPDLLGDRVRKAFPTYDEQGWGLPFNTIVKAQTSLAN